MEKLSELISVIVCTYNQEDTVGRTLDSILAQECHLPVEIVVGDDGSTDGTRAVCQKYRDRHPDTIRLMPAAPNKGFVKNYFDCLQACRGKYIADCAGDDFWTDNHKLEKSSVLLEQAPGVGIVHTDWLRYNEQTGQLTSPEKPTDNRLQTTDNGLQTTDNGQWSITDGSSLLADILMPGERPAVHLCTALYRKDWICRAMHEYPQFFDPDTYRCEDVQIAFFLARMGDVGFLPDQTLAYSCGGTSVSNPDSEEKQFSFWANVTRLSYDLAQTFGIASTSLDRFFQARLHKLLMHAFRSGKPSLKANALLMQKKMHIADNRRTRLAKLLLLPGIWQTMRFGRNLIKQQTH